MTTNFTKGIDPKSKMKIIDGLKLKGKPAEIPDCSRDDLPQFFINMGFKVGAEIGVAKGEFSKKFCKVGLQLYSIDPWRFNKDYHYNLEQEGFDLLHKHTQKVLFPYSNSTIVRKTSMEAVKDFEDESLDFVYIDGNHQFKFVAEDIYEWSKKLKKGGVISGHDYTFANPTNHVIYAVNGYTKAYKIHNWYLLGRKDPLPGEKKDRFRSWMWIKKTIK